MKGVFHRIHRIQPFVIAILALADWWIIKSCIHDATRYQDLKSGAAMLGQIPCLIIHVMAVVILIIDFFKNFETSHPFVKIFLPILGLIGFSAYILSLYGYYWTSWIYVSCGMICLLLIPCLLFTKRLPAHQVSYLLFLLFTFFLQSIIYYIKAHYHIFSLSPNRIYSHINYNSILYPGACLFFLTQQFHDKIARKQSSFFKINVFMAIISIIGFLVFSYANRFLKGPDFYDSSLFIYFKIFCILGLACGFYCFGTVMHDLFRKKHSFWYYFTFTITLIIPLLIDFQYLSHTLKHAFDLLMLYRIISAGTSLFYLFWYVFLLNDRFRHLLPYSNKET